MNISKWPRGSEWRKWDLHVHTPSSIVNNYGGCEKDTWDHYISDLENLPKEFKVLGINDYLFLDGYKKVLNYKNKGRLKNIELLLPVMEFRISDFAGAGKKLSKINFHVIFAGNDILQPKVIETQFFNALSTKFTLSSETKELEWSRSINREGLIEFGKMIIESIPKDKQKGLSPLMLGFSNMTFNRNDIYKLLENNDLLKGKYLTAIGKTEWDQLRWESDIAHKKDIINSSDLVFTASESVESYKKAKRKLEDQNVNSLLLDCSDSHNFSNSSDKDRIGNCFTWIKADPTFSGLRQVLNEPSERIFVGETPKELERIYNNKTKYIDRLEIKKKTSSRLNEKWFEKIELEFNPGLVSIIGNKGKGKSALTDIIALTAGIKQYRLLSFLSDKKFRASPEKKAKEFCSEISWKDGQKNKLDNLLDNPTKTNIERIKYLPQSYIENICNQEYPEEFKEELENVIYSHLPLEERQSKLSLNEIIQEQTVKFNALINQKRLDMQKINEKIVSLGKKIKPEYKAKNEEFLQEKNRELIANNQIKPKKVEKPTIEETEKEKDNLLSKKNALLISIEEKIEKNNAEKDLLKKEEEDFLSLVNQIEELKENYKKLVEESNYSFGTIEFNVKDLVKLKIDENKINNLKNTLIKKRKQINSQLDEENEDSIAYKKKNLLKEINQIKEKLAAPLKKYQDYLATLKKWKEKEEKIIGDINTPDTIKFFERKIEEIKFIPKKLEEEEKKRKEIAKDIFSSLQQIIEIYCKLYKPVQDFCSKYQNIIKEIKLEFSTNLTIINFIDSFFSFISNGVSGSFYGKAEGRNLLKEIIDSNSIGDFKSMEKFLENIIFYLEHPKGNKNEKISLEKQLREGKEIVDFYNFLFNLEYIKPEYSLKLDGKNLKTLSPGEKGFLLLVFYLLIDKSEIPLIIDQPEDNLDNETVFKSLVWCIKEAKKRRQIIIVTHNPNLAVVCDSEQIIYANIDKKDGNKVTYTSGSIEEPNINKKIIDILEGTRPAFDNRDLKYRISDNK